MLHSNEERDGGGGRCLTPRNHRACIDPGGRKPSGMYTCPGIRFLSRPEPAPYCRVGRIKTISYVSRKLFIN